MAIYHLSAQIISRGNSGPKAAKAGKSVVSMAAYRVAEKMKDERTGIEYDYTKKLGVEFKQILSPENAPVWVYNREKLWNEVEKSEKRTNAQLGREMNIALPVELSKEQQKELVNEFIKDNFVNKGMIADIAFHYEDNNNPHIHVMLTRREISENGFGAVRKDWFGGDFKGKPGEEQRKMIEETRAKWADYANRHLEKAKSNERIDHRSYKAQGIEKVPQYHMGPNVKAMEKKGILTKIGDLNRRIKEFNRTKIVKLEGYKELKSLRLEEKSKLKPKKFKAKTDDIFIQIDIRKRYKKELPAAANFTVSQSKALFNLNSFYGTQVTIHQIYVMYNALITAKHYDELLLAEAKRLSEATSLLKGIDEKTKQISDLKQNPITMFLKKCEINMLKEERKALKSKLDNYYIKDWKELGEKNNKHNKMRNSVDKDLKELKVVSEAKKAVGDARRQALEKKQKKNKKCNREYLREQYLNYERNREGRQR